MCFPHHLALQHWVLYRVVCIGGSGRKVLTLCENSSAGLGFSLSRNATSEAPPKADVYYAADVVPLVRFVVRVAFPMGI